MASDLNCLHFLCINGQVNHESRIEKCIRYNLTVNNAFKTNDSAVCI